MKQWKGKFGRLKKYVGILRAGRLSPIWFLVFLSSLTLAMVLPIVLEKIGAIATAICPLVSGIFLKFHDAREKLRSVQAEIAKIASEMHLDKEQVQKAFGGSK